MVQATTLAVIGGTGFIGRHLLDRLARQGRRIRVLVHQSTPPALGDAANCEYIHGTLHDAASLNELLAGTSGLINLAGQVSAEIDDYQALNLRGMVAVAQACIRHDLRRVVHISSALVYGDATNAAEDSPRRPISPYATMKLAAEEILAALLNERMQLLSLRLANVYGPHQHKGIMPYLIERIQKHEPVTINANGAQIRDFIHVDDVADAIVLAIEAETVGALNIGSGVATSIMSLLRLLERSLEISVTGQYRPENSGGERASTVNVTRAQAELGWKATISLEDGLTRVLGGNRCRESIKAKA
jgi:UDP-glucose 4-epimerase